MQLKREIFQRLPGKTTRLTLYRHVTKALNHLMKDVRGKTVEGDVDEDNLHDMVGRLSNCYTRDITPLAYASERTTRERLHRESKGKID